MILTSASRITIKHPEKLANKVSLQRTLHAKLGQFGLCAQDPHDRLLKIQTATVIFFLDPLDNPIKHI